jgi:hypothetical protein
LKNNDPDRGVRKATRANAPRKRAARIPAHQDIAMRAYALFLKGGARHGHDVDHWLAAERELIDNLVSTPG